MSCSNDTLDAVTDKIGCAPSVLFDAVAILPGSDSLATLPAADCLRDAFVLCEFIGWAEQATSRIDVCGLAEVEDNGLCRLIDLAAVARFVTACKSLWEWPREERFIA